MNAQKLTEKSLEAIQSANDMAISHQNQMIQQVLTQQIAKACQVMRLFFTLAVCIAGAGERLDSAAV